MMLLLRDLHTYSYPSFLIYNKAHNKKRKARKVILGRLEQESYPPLVLLVYHFSHVFRIVFGKLYIRLASQNTLSNFKEISTNIMKFKNYILDSRFSCMVYIPLVTTSLCATICEYSSSQRSYVTTGTCSLSRCKCFVLVSII